MKRVLIIKMWALGDIVMATPMIAALRARHQDIHISWLIDASHGDLLRGHPGIDDLIVVDTGAWRRLLRRGNLVSWIRFTLRIRRDMRARQFDAVINCHPDKWWTSHLCAAPVRIGLYPSVKAPASSRFYTTALTKPVGGLHDTKHYLLATQALGCPDAGYAMTVGQADDEEPFIRRFEAEHGIDRDTPIVILSPFSTAENKCWPPDRYAALAERLCAANGPTVNSPRIVMTLGPRDIEAARRIASASRVPIVLAEATTLRQYVALLRRADLVVSGDSSPMHVAAAVGTPFVALFGPTDPKLLAPLIGGGSVLAPTIACAPCNSSRCSNATFRECLLQHSVERVHASATEHLPILLPVVTASEATLQ